MGVWLGGVCLLSFVVAPGAFRILGNRDMAGSMVAYTLGRAHLIGIGAGVIYLVAQFLHPHALPNIARLAAIAVILMLLLTVFSQFYVIAHLADLRTQMGSVDRTPANRSSTRRIRQAASVVSVARKRRACSSESPLFNLTVRAS